MSTSNSKWEFNDIFGKFVDDSRMSLNELAQHSGVSAGTLKNWKDGTSRPNKSRWGDIVRVAAALGLDRSDTDLLLRSAGLPSLDECQTLIRSNEQKLAKTELETLQKAIDKILSPKVSFGMNSFSSHALSKPPLERPRRPEFFTGREKELVDLLDNLQPGRIVTLWGPGGIGKTALAAEAIWKLAPSDRPSDRFPDGIIYYSFYGQPEVEKALEHIARSFGEELKPSPRDAAQRALAGRRALLLLDGAEQIEDKKNVSTLSLILDIHDQSCVLITSRSRRDSLAIRHDLSPLSIENAIELLQAWGGRRATNREAARRISELVGQLPLALRLVGRYLAWTDEEASEYLVWLEKTPLVALDQGKRQEESVPLLLDRSVARIGRNAQEVLAIVGVLALALFTRDAITAGLNITSEAALDALGTLVEYGLVIRPEQDYEVTHALIHTYAHIKLPPTTEDIVRLTTYFTTFVNEHQNQFHELDRARRHTLTLLRNAEKYQAWKEINSLAASIEGYLGLRGTAVELIEVNERGLNAARAIINRTAECGWLINLGNVHLSLTQAEQASEYFQQALLISKEINDLDIEGMCLGSFGTLYRVLGDITLALQYLSQAITHARERVDLNAAASYAGNVGSLLLDSGREKEAFYYLEEALFFAKECNDRRLEGEIVLHLGNAYFSVGSIEQAATSYDQALAIARELGDRKDEAMCLNATGNIHLLAEQYSEAASCFRQAVLVIREIGDKRTEGIILNNLGSVYREQEQYEQALDCYNQALAIARSYAIRQEEGLVLGNLGYMYKLMNQSEQAINYLGQAIIIFGETKQFKKVCVYTNEAGQILLSLGKIEEAQKCAQSLIEVAKDIGDKVEEDRGLVLMGAIYSALGEVEKAWQHWQKTDTIGDSIKKVIYLIYGETNIGIRQYTYLEVKGENIKKLMKAYDSGSFEPGDYGDIIRMGLGDPPPEVMEEMEKEYGVDHSKYGLNTPAKEKGKNLLGKFLSKIKPKK